MDGSKAMEITSKLVYEDAKYVFNELYGLPVPSLHINQVSTT